MKHSAGVMGLIVALAISVSATEPDQSTLRRLSKAEEILQRDTEVVTDGAVGYAGALPETNWALAVILSQDPRPLARLQRIAENSTVEGTLMCLQGIRYLDRAEYEKAVRAWRTTLFEPNDGIEVMSGCTIQRMPATQALEILERWEKTSFLREPVPPLEETIRVRRTTAGYKTMNENVTIAVGTSAPSRSFSGPMPSGK